MQRGFSDFFVIYEALVLQMVVGRALLRDGLESWISLAEELLIGLIYCLYSLVYQQSVALLHYYDLSDYGGILSHQFLHGSCEDLLVPCNYLQPRISPREE